jgi:hypothetical protein
MAIPTKASMESLDKILKSEKVTIELPSLFLPRLIKVLKQHYLPDAEKYLKMSEEISYDWQVAYDVVVVKKTILALEGVKDANTL